MHFQIKQGGALNNTAKVFKGVAVGLLFMLLCACGAGSNVPDSYSAGNGASGARQPGAEIENETETEPGTGVVPQGGDWSASQMSFSVSSDGALVERFEVTYSGRATNDRCDFDYSDLAMVNDLDIKNGLFTYDDGDLVIKGSFTDTQEAEVTVLWFGYYGGACQVDYNGELMVVATADEATLEE